MGQLGHEYILVGKPDMNAKAVELRFKCRIYYKFALAEGAFWLLSLHQDRPLKEDK